MSKSRFFIFSASSLKILIFAVFCDIYRIPTSGVPSLMHALSFNFSQLRES